MDPVTLIVTALAAGATAGITDAASAMITDTYKSFRALLSKWFKGSGNSEQIIDEHAKDPDTYSKPAIKVVRESGAATDPEVIEAARKLLELVDPSGAAAGKYHVSAPGSIIGAIGDNAVVTYGAVPEGSRPLKDR